LTLGRTIIARDLKAARRTFDRLKGGFQIVTLAGEVLRSSGESHDPYAISAWIAIQRSSELWPIVVDYLSGDDIDTVAHLGHGQSQVLDIDELPTEIRMGGPVAIRRIEVTLRIEEGKMHRVHHT